jgi:hypothetical protein
LVGFVRSSRDGIAKQRAEVTLEEKYKAVLERLFQSRGEGEKTHPEKSHFPRTLPKQKSHSSEEQAGE